MTLLHRLGLAPRRPPGDPLWWHPGVAGRIVRTEFFGSTAIATGLMTVWDGSDWVAKPVRVWTGTEWATKPIRVWTGTEWRATGAPAGPAAFSARDASFLLLGHSLMDTKPRDALRSWNTQASITADGQQTITPGASLAYQWDNMPPATGVNARSYLASPGVDVFVAAEAGPITALGGSAGSPTLPLEYGDLWMQLAWANGTRPLLMAIWPYTNTGTPGYISGIGASNGDTDPTMLWRPKLDHLRAHYEAIIGYIHARMPEGGAALRLVPGDALMAALYDAALAGDLTGVAATESAFFDTVFDTGETNPIHLTLYGWYAVCCLHYACIYGQSPVGLSTSWTDQWDVPYSGMPSPTQAAELQAIAWSVAQADPLGPFGSQIPDDPYASAGGGGAADWWAPATAQQITTLADPFVTSATLAWSYRYAAGTIDGAASHDLFATDQFCFVNLNGGSDGGGRGIGSLLVNDSWSNSVSMADEPGFGTFLMPATTYNFVLLISSAGALSGGHTAELWVNGSLVRSTSAALSNVGLRDMYMLASRGGAAITPGETQGWWYSRTTVVPAATMFADLFNGADGLRDLTSAVIGGVTPDVVRIGPPA